VPRSFPPSQTDIYENEIPFFAALAHLGKQGYIAFCTSRQLQFEKTRQPSFNRFRFGYNVWSSVDLEVLPDIHRPSKESSIVTKEWFGAEAQTDRILSTADADFLFLTQRIPRKHVLDFYHLWTAKKHGCSVFLTTDKRLKRIISSLPQDLRAMIEPVAVKFPSELGRALGLHPVPHKFLTPIDADWFYVIQ
jgi:hypothetical protein